MGLEITTDRHPPITSQARYPLRHAAANINLPYRVVDPCTHSIQRDSARNTNSVWEIEQILVRRPTSASSRMRTNYASLCMEMVCLYEQQFHDINAHLTTTEPMLNRTCSWLGIFLEYIERPCWTTLWWRTFQSKRTQWLMCWGHQYHLQNNTVN